MATDHKGKQSGFANKGRQSQGKTSSFGKPAGAGYGSRGAGQGFGDKAESRSYGKPANQGYGKKTAGQGYGSKPAGQSFGGKKTFGQDNRQFDGRPATSQRSGYNPNARDSRQQNTSAAPGNRQGRPAGFGDRNARPFGRGGNPGPGGSFDNRGGNQRFGDRYQRDNRAPQTEAQWRESPAAKRFGPTSQPGRPFAQPAPAGRQQARPHRQPQAPAFQKPQAPVLPDTDTDVFSEESIGQVNLLTGRNPIREAIKTGRDLEKLMIAKGELTGSAKEIVSMAKKAGIMIQSVERSRLDQLAKNHQGMIAYASAYQYASVEDILASAKEKGEDPFIIVLDQITDPHNLGAVIRTLVCAGAHGVIVPQHRAVGLTPAAVKASSGAVEHTKVARVTNLNQTIKALQKQGIWFYCATTDGEDYRKQAMTGPCALVIGSEGEGVSQLTASLCDKAISIPMAGEIGSLNASVAAAVLMYSVFDARNPV